MEPQSDTPQKERHPVKTGCPPEDALQGPVDQIVPSARHFVQKRVMVYVDGFNLYFGMRASRLQKYYWLNVWEMAQRLMRNGHVLAGVRYFSARINRPADKVARQATYLEALQSVPQIQITLGKYRSDEARCEQCDHPRWIDNEKMTDVNIAVAMLLDAAHDRFDLAMLVSGDGDLLPVVHAVQSSYIPKEVWIVPPPNRSHPTLLAAAKGRLKLREWILRESQFPDIVTSASGFPLRRPAEWSGSSTP